MIHVVPESRAFGLIPMTVGISFLFILLFTILNGFFFSLSFVQLSVASWLIAALYMVLVVLHFIIVSAKTLIDSLQNDCDVLEKAVQLSVFVHPNKESHLLYLSVSTRAVIGQFSGPYFTVRPAKACFGRQNDSRDIINILLTSFSRSVL